MNKYTNEGINNNTFDLLFCNVENLPEEEWGSLEDISLFGLISTFTLRERDASLVSRLKSIGFDINDITYDEENACYKYLDEKYNIPFEMISDYIDNEYIKDELTSEKRFGNCHTMSTIFAYSIENSMVVTGYIKALDQLVLHSIIEYSKDDETYVIDWTRNVKMLKSDYERLTGFTELARFNGDVCYNDLGYLESLNINSKSYVCFRDEIINDIKKNKRLFKREK